MKSLAMSAFSFLFLGLAACSSSSSDEGGKTTDPPAPDPGGTSASPSPGGTSVELTCKSYGFCTSDDVARYHGAKLPAARGGKVADGLYKLAYVLDPEGTGVTPRADTGGGLLIRGPQFLMLGVGSAGFFETTEGSAAEITFTPVELCDSERAAASNGDGREAWSRPYLVDERGRLVIFGALNNLAYVYVQANKLCGSPSDVPREPGSDSSSCGRSSCGCSEATAASADAETCKLVRHTP